MGQIRRDEIGGVLTQLSTLATFVISPCWKDSDLKETMLCTINRKIQLFILHSIITLKKNIAGTIDIKFA